VGAAGEANASAEKSDERMSYFFAVEDLDWDA
jgi:hypothetical protein